MSRADRRRLSLRQQVAMDVGTGAMVAEHAALRAERAARLARWAIGLSIATMVLGAVFAILLVRGLVLNQSI